MRCETRFLVGAALGSLVIASSVLAFAGAQDVAAGAKKAGDKAEVTVVVFGNEKCPTTGKPIKQDKFVEADGQRVYFCCGNCQGKAKADAAAAIAKAYAEVKPVGNKKCPIEGNAIEAGKGKQVTFQGRSFELCSAGCEAAFKKDPALALAKAMYPNAKVAKVTKCVMMDEDIDPQVMVVYKDQIVRFCCPDCIGDFKKDPDAAVAKLGK